MHVLIVGAGVVGSNLAKQFSIEGHDVAVVDKDIELIRKLTEKFDVIALQGDGASPKTLETAGIERAAMVIAVTDSDAVNMLVCATASRYGVGQKVARVREKEFVQDQENFYRETFHIDQLINPEELIAESLSAMVRVPACVEMTRFASGEILLGGFSVGSDVPLTGRTIQEGRQDNPDVHYLMVAVSRRGELFIPRGDDTLEPGDKAYVVMPGPDLESFVPLVTRAEFQKKHRVVLAAGSPESQRLAASLEEHGHEVAVIEKDPQRARIAADTLTRSIVYQGEATDVDLLKEAGIDKADFFIAAGPGDESNLLAALLAKRQGAKRTVVFTREAEHLPVLQSIGLDVVINPRLATAGAILHLVRRGEILQAAKLGHSDAEALHFEIPPKAPAIGKPLSQLDIPREAIVGAVQNGDSVTIAEGSTVLEAGDRVVVFTMPSAIPGVERLFAAK